MPESIFFKSPAHKNLFLAAIEPHIHGNELDAEYGSALYLLTSDLYTWHLIMPFVSGHEISFRKFLVKRRLSHTERGMIELAWHLFNHYDHRKIDLFNSVFSSDENQLLALTAFEIRRQRMSIDRFE
jgi:hypothetical protein